MLYRPLGKSGIKASVVGLGTWAIGGWMWGGTDEKAAISAIHAAIDSGINLIDTAPAYGFGVSEKIVGKAICDRRNKVVLATKCGLIWHKEEGEFFFYSDEKRPHKEAIGKKIYRSLTPENIRYEIEQSLKRIGTDVIDLYQTHWQDSTTPIEETMNELLKLKKEGKIKAIGACNATVAQLDDYRKAGPLDIDQEGYSMLDRKPEKDLLPYCSKNNLAFLAYSPLAQGLLTGKISPERKFEDGDQRNMNPRFSLENRQKIAKMLEEFKLVAQKYNLTFAQLAIAWTVQQPGCTHALVGARRPEQAIENANAGNTVLADEDIKAITAVIEKYFGEE
ncbi:MAG: aldo/keto reductase [Spirochaetes bacterium]|nr:aldo/keto reductase [Spirochaetota bacterium]